MKKLPQISEAEWQVMKVLWGESPLKSSEVIEKLKDSTDWKPKTIKTLLSRLVKKEALTYKEEKNAYLYYPIVSENECIKEETKSFINRVYDGSLNLLVKNFVEEQELSEQEIAELKKILGDK